MSFPLAIALFIIIRKLIEIAIVLIAIAEVLFSIEEVWLTFAECTISGRLLFLFTKVFRAPAVALIALQRHRLSLHKYRLQMLKSSLGEI
jgi:hypothetical protein